MANDPPDAWSLLWANVQNLRNKLRSVRAVQVNSAEVRTLARRAVQDYFRTVRPDLGALGLDISGLDEAMQELLQLANGRARKNSYARCLSSLARLRAEMEPLRELRFGQLVAERQEQSSAQSAVESKIIVTLQKLVPSAALSYQQAIGDLAIGDRLSYRGVAAELREVLREVLEYLAPDKAVAQSSGFQLEDGQNRPTMKQKVRFILKSRGVPGSARKAPENAVSLVEELTCALARSVYDRGSLSTHVTASKQEVKQLKMYVDTLLAELLEIHA